MIETKVYYREAGTDFDQLIFQDTGAATKRTLDNSLNSGLFELSKTTRQETFPRYHGIRFVFDDGTDIKQEDYRILGDVTTLEAKGSQKRWKHLIQLIEPTKLHERVYVGSKSFSRNKDGSAIYTLLDVITTLRTIARIEREDLLSALGDLFNIPTDVETILDRFDAPQLFFKDVTLREAIDGALSFIDATYELDLNNNMILRFFNDRTGEVTEIGDFDDEMRVVAGDYYSSEMDVLAQNLVNDKVLLPAATPEGINRHTVSLFSTLQNSQNPTAQIREIQGTFGSAGSTTGGPLPATAKYGDGYECDTNGYTDPTSGITFDSGEFAVYRFGFWGTVKNIFGIAHSTGAYFRCEDVVLGDGNMILKLSQDLRIYEVEDVYIGVREESANVLRSALCTEFFVTDAQYALLKDKSLFIDEFPNRQNTVKYKIGGDTVEGFGTSWGVFGLQRTLDYMIRSITQRSSDNLGGPTGPIALQLDPFDNEQVLFTFVYRPIVPKMRITAARTNIEDINIKSSIRENQNENVLSIQNYGNNLLAKANRFGNEVLTHTETVTSLAKLKDRGYVIPGSNHILTEVEKTIWPEFLKVKYTFIKWFNRYSQFIGLAGRRRQYELLPEDTIDRLLNYTEYLQVVPGDVPFENSTVFSDFAIERIIESLLFNLGDNTVRGAILTSDDFDIDPSELYNYSAGNTAGIYLPVFKTGAVKSLLFTFSMADTLSAGDRIQEDPNDSDVRVKRAVSYTDSDGFLQKMRIKFINYINPEWEISNKVDFDKFRGDSKNAPAVVLENINIGNDLLEYTNGEYRVEKDLAERVAWTQQLQFLGYKNQIGIGNEWARLCQLILDLPGPALYLYVSFDTEYGLLEDKKVKSDALKLDNINTYIELIDRQLVLNSSGRGSVRGAAAWAIGDNDGNLLLFVNQKSFGDTLILSFKATNERDDIIVNAGSFSVIETLTAAISQQSFSGSDEHTVILSSLTTTNETVLGITTGKPQIKELGTYRFELLLSDYVYSGGIGSIVQDLATSSNLVGSQTGGIINFLYDSITTNIPESIDLDAGGGLQEIRIKQEVIYDAVWTYDLDLDAEVGTGQNKVELQLVVRDEITGDIIKIIDSVEYTTGGTKVGTLAAGYHVKTTDIGIYTRLVVTGDTTMEHTLNSGDMQITSDFEVDLRYDAVLETAEGEIFSQVLDARFPSLSTVFNWDIPANHLNNDIELKLKGRNTKVSEGTLSISSSTFKINKVK